MQNFVDYYSNFFARRLFRQERANIEEENAPETTATDTPAVSPEELSTDLLDYAIFFNEGSGHQSASEIKEQNADYRRRWLTFYVPDTNALPQHNNILQLQAEQEVLRQQHVALNSPLLAGLLICLIIAAILSFRHLALLIVPAAVFALIWAKTGPALSASARQLESNEQNINKQQDLLINLQKQARPLRQVESLHTLRENYTRCLEGFLQESILQSTPQHAPLDMDSLNEKIHSGEVSFYALESRGILQIPDIFHQNTERLLALDTLLHKNDQGWFAVQPDEALRGLTRLHYFYGIICLEHGAIVCNAFYDWVSNQLYAKQCDHYSYQHMHHMRAFETNFPPNETLREELSDEVYQLHFGEPVNIVSLEVNNGEHYYCALPVRQPTRQTTLNHLPNIQLCRHLQHDHQSMITAINQRIEAQK